MSIRRYILPLILCLALVATGCRSQRDAAGRTPGDNDAATGTTARPNYYTANFEVTARGLTANGQIRMMQDSIIWVSASKVIELGRAKFTPDTVTVYIMMMNRYFRGTYDDLYNKFHFRTDFKTLSETVMSENSEQLLAEMAKAFGIEATIKMEPWKKVEKLSFPLTIPSQVKPI
jgi:hypothetical protein